MNITFKKVLLIKGFVAVLVVGFTHLSHAGTTCTPGIPCTTYDITTNTDAATNQSYNAWKGGGRPSDTPAFTATSCDANYMNQMLGEAFIHAQREVAMNEQIIRKPDSVLEYTCFDQYMAVAANNAGILSESTNWQNRSIDLQTADETQTHTFTVTLPGGPLANRIDNALNGVITNALNRHINNNFAHNYLGGAAGINSNMNLSNIAGGSYNCTEMESVWDLAQCVNFGEDDNFVSFGQLMTGDPRQLPAACNGTAAPALNAGTPVSGVAFVGPVAAATSSAYVSALDALGIMTINETNPCPASANTGLVTADQIRLANNCEMAFSSYETAKSYFQYVRDPWYSVDNLWGLLSSFPIPVAFWGPANLGCGPPIPTGIRIPYYLIGKVVIAGVDTAVNTADPLAPFGAAGLDYQEHVCPNPSCSFIPGLNWCVPPI